MRSLKITGLAVCVVLAYGTIASAAQVDYFNYQNFGGTWWDAEKSPANPDDDYMCWAASASNVLQWTGWGDVAGLKTSDAIFSYFVQHWTDNGGLMQYGWEWWFNGTNEMQGRRGWSQVNVPGGDFYPTYDFSQYLSVESNPRLAMTAIKNNLQAGNGVGIGIYTRKGGHAITAWGIRYDSATNQPLGIWVTDSDDSDSQANPPDLLQYYAVDNLGGKFYLRNFYGTTDVWYIGEVEALARKLVVAGLTTNWTGGISGWETGTNWDQGTPTSAVTAKVDNGGTAQIASSASARELDLGVNSSGNAQLLSGSLTLATGMMIGGASGSSGTFTLSGGSFSAPTVYVGQGGNGTFTHNGGTAAIANSLNLGSAIGSHGEYNLQSGALQAPTQIIGNNGTGVFNQNGGTNNVSTLLSIGNVNGLGTYNIGGGALNAKDITVGSSGRFNITSNSASIRLTGNLTFADYSQFSAVAGSKIVMSGGGVIAQFISLNDLAGLANTEFVFNGGFTKVSQFSFWDDGSFTLGDDFDIGKLTIGDVSGAGRLKLVDPYNAGFHRYYGVDNLSLKSLLINPTSYFDLNGFTLSLPGDLASALDSWISDRRLRDSSIGSTYYLDAVYDPANSWTTVQAYYKKGKSTGRNTISLPLFNNPTYNSLHGVAMTGYVEGSDLTIPEPSTILALGLGLLALAGSIARKIGR